MSIMFLKSGEGYTTGALLNFILRVLSCVPIYIVGIAVIDFLVIIFKKEVLVYIFYLIAILIFPTILELIEQKIWSGFEIIKDGLFISALQPLTIQAATKSEIYFAIVLGIAYIIVISIINIRIFSNQEIK